MSIRQVLDDGLLGTVHTVLVDHGEWFAADHRIMRPELAGGPLLDLGTYAVTMVERVLGTPEEILARGTPAPTGVNGQTSALLTFAGGSHAVVNTTILADTPIQAVFAGGAATLTLPRVYFRPGPFSLRSAGGAQRLDYVEPESGYDGLAYQAAEAARRIVAGEQSTPVRPVGDSVATLAIIDEIRRQLGVTFDELS